MRGEPLVRIVPATVLGLVQGALDEAEACLSATVPDPMRALELVREANIALGGKSGSRESALVAAARVLDGIDE